MAEPVNTPVRATATSDEIDLLDLVSTLWQRKFLIIIIAALGFAGAYGLSLLMKEEWRSTALVVSPRVQNTEELLAKNRAIARVITPEEDIDVNNVLNNAFEVFLNTAADSEEKYSYLASSELFKRLQESNKDSTPGAILDELSQRLLVEIPDEKKKSLSQAYSLSFTSDDAESAQTTLAGYIDNINKVAIKTARLELTNNLEARIALLKQQLGDIERDLSTSRQVALETYRDALLTAQKAGIKSAPTGVVGRSDNNSSVVLEINANPQQLYLQGEEVLQALIDVKTNEPVIFPKNYYRLKYEIEELEKARELTAEFQAFNYQMRPTLPTKRLSPKRAQLAVLGGVVGGVLASLYVLLASAFANRRRTQAS